MIRLTTAHYYTPSGRCIQKPYTDGIEDYQKDYLHRMEKGELFSKDSVVLNKKEKFETKLNKRTVYGGGGIMPDLFIPLDTSKYYIYYNNLSRKNVIYPAALDLVDKNRSDFQQKYKDFKTFDDKFEVTDEMVNKIMDDGEKEGVKKNEKSVAFARPLLKKQVKALIARDLFTVSEYFQVMNAEDESIKKAAAILNKRGEYEKILEGKEK